MLTNLQVEGFKGLDAEYDLHPLTAIVADMTEGKTAILEAIQLAIRGSIEGVGEMTLADFFSGQVVIQATGRGVQGTYMVPWEGGPKMRRAEHASHGIGSHALPVVSLSKLANGGPALESAILARFGQGELIVPESMLATVREEWPKATDAPLLSVSGAGAYLSHCKRQSMSLGRQVSALEKKASSIEVSATDAAELVTLEAQLRRWESAVEKYGDKWMRAYIPKEAVAEMRQCKEAATAAKKETEKLQTQIGVHQSIKDSVTLYAQQDMVECPLCRKGTINVAEEREKRARRIALDQAKLAQKRAEAAKNTRRIDEIKAQFRPDVDAMRRRKMALAETATRQDMQTQWVQEAMRLRTQQQDIQNTAQAIKIALDSNRKSAFSQASSRIDDLAVPGIKVSLLMKGPKWIVETRGGPRFGSLSGSQHMSVALAAPLVFGDDEGPRIVLLDDEELAGFSSAGVTVLLEHFASLVNQGVLTQVIATRHTDRAQEIPSSYRIINP